MYKIRKQKLYKIRKQKLCMRMVQAGRGSYKELSKHPASA